MILLLCARGLNSGLIVDMLSGIVQIFFHTTTIRLTALCPGRPGWASTRKKTFNHSHLDVCKRSSGWISYDNIFMSHNHMQKSVPNFDVSFANGELHQAYGHVTLTMSTWPKYNHRSLVGCRPPHFCSYSWPPCVRRMRIDSLSCLVLHWLTPCLRGCHTSLVNFLYFLRSIASSLHICILHIFRTLFCEFLFASMCSWPHLPRGRFSLTTSTVVSHRKIAQHCASVEYSTKLVYSLPSVVWHCRKSSRPVRNWVLGCWRGYLFAARCKWFAYGPASTTATPSSVDPWKSRIVFTFLVPAYPGCPGKKAAKRGVFK